MYKNLGYCCINMTLKEKNPSVKTNRRLTKKMFTKNKQEEISLLNIFDLKKILEWNEENGIKVFRISSDLFPRITCPDFGCNISDLSNFNQISKQLKAIGDFAILNGHKLSFHPNHFVCLGSDKERVIENSIKDIEMHSNICDLIDPNNMLDIPINIHIGGNYGSQYKLVSSRFSKAFFRLSKDVQKRLVIENDDKKKGWSAQKLYHYIYSEIGTPITFDIHHWNFCHDQSSMQDDFKLAFSTWDNRNMQVHYSQSAKGKKTAHSDYFDKPIPSFIEEYPVYVHLECKEKDRALLKYKNDFCFSCVAS